jgi:hypothetical protein
VPGGHADVVAKTVRRCERRPFGPSARIVKRQAVAHVRPANVKRCWRTTATRVPFSTTSYPTTRRLGVRRQVTVTLVLVTDTTFTLRGRAGRGTDASVRHAPLSWQS